MTVANDRQEMTGMRNSLQKKTSVLVIDDSRSFRQYLNELLTGEGYDVKEAANGLEGLACIRTLDPDIVLLDVEMPILDGMGVLEQIESEKREFSVVMLTSRDSLETRVAGLESGADDYIIKPCEEKELISRVKAAERIARYKHALVRAKNESIELLEKYRQSQSRLVAQHKLNALSRMAAAMAHSINNPLGFARSNLVSLTRFAGRLAAAAERVANGQSAGDAAEINKVAAEITPLVAETVSGLDRVSVIVKRLQQLDLGSGQNDGSTEDLAPVLVKLAEEARTRYSDIDITAEIAEVPMVTRCSLNQVTAALENIIENAAEAAGCGGTIQIRAERKGGDIVIDITDSGCGIAAEVMPKIFEPFFTTSAAPDRLGLGLTIAYHLIAANGGEVEIHPADTRGTVVNIRYPEIWKNRGLPGE